MSFLARIKEIFISKEKKYTFALNEELENKNFVNLKKIPSKLSVEQRYKLVVKLQSSNELQGVLIRERMLFLAISEDDLSDLKNRLKETGSVKIADLKDRWKLKDNILDLLLQHFERGIMGEKTYYSIKFLQNYFSSNLRKGEEHDLKQMSKRLGLEDSVLIPFVQKMLDDSTILGVIRNQHLFIDSETFKTMIAEYLEEIDETETEKEYNDIAKDLGVLPSVVERYLVDYVEKNPGRFTVYPLEKKLRIKW